MNTPLSYFTGDESDNGYTLNDFSRVREKIGKISKTKLSQHHNSIDPDTPCIASNGGICPWKVSSIGDVKITMGPNGYCLINQTCQKFEDLGAFTCSGSDEDVRSPACGSKGCRGHQCQILTQGLSPKFITEFQDDLDWCLLPMVQVLTEDIIRENQHRISFQNLSSGPTCSGGLLSESFVREFEDKFGIEKMFKINGLSYDYMQDILSRHKEHYLQCSDEIISPSDEDGVWAHDDDSCY